jgi:hypothetical protein
LDEHDVEDADHAEEGPNDGTYVALNLPYLKDEQLDRVDFTMANGLFN